MTDHCVVLITAAKGKEPERLARMLLKKKLCACVNIIGSVDSFFWWKAKIERATESLLVVKTRRRLLPALMREVRRAHSYAVCEIIALPIIAGNRAYLDWITDSCRKDKAL